MRNGSTAAAGKPPKKHRGKVAGASLVSVTDVLNPKSAVYHAEFAAAYKAGRAEADS